MLLVTLIAALFFTTEAKPISSLLPVDEAATQYFTNLLGNFSEVQQNGYPDRGLQAVDPFVVPGFSLEATEGDDTINFTFSNGFLLGASNNTISAVVALTDDNSTYEIAYTVTTNSYSFSAPYTAQGEIDGETITASGVFSLTADHNLRFVTLIAVKQGERYFLDLEEETGELLNPVLNITGLPEAAQQVVDQDLFQYSIELGTWGDVETLFMDDEAPLLAVYFLLNPQ
jgi:hypothetical protein